MKLLVTGGAGFIGSNFINYWLDKHSSDEVINLDLMTYAANPITVQRHKAEFGSRYKHVKGNITDTSLVDKLVNEVDLIVHFAAETHVDRSVTNPHAFLETNVLGTHTLLNAALKHDKKRFHHISTDEVFGTLELESAERFNEQTNYDPRSPYSASKAGADHIVRAYFETYDLPVTITNCSNNYGPYHFPEKVIPLYITRLLQDKPIPVYGEGKAVRDYLHVKDHSRAIELVIEKGSLGESYCVGGDSEKNTVQIAKAIIDALGKSEDLIKFTKDRPGHDPRYAIDHSKITTELGWKPEYTFETGIEATIEWYKQNQEWWKPVSALAEQIAESYLENQ